MKLLVLGADGMLGHQLVASLRDSHDIHGTLRQQSEAYATMAHFLPDYPHFGIDVRDYAPVRDLLELLEPDAVINAVGVVKQRPDAGNAILSLEVNSLLPHRLAETCAAIGSFLVQISTDCAFSGMGGNYREDDFPDARDLYGRSKLLGEVDAPGSITFRTSIIGLELYRKTSLVEWFLAQRGTVKGFRRAIYSGFTTMEMARIIEHVLVKQQSQNGGMYHVSSDPIDKFTLLCMLNDRLGRATAIVPDDEFECDRSLDSERFRSEFAYSPPTWARMLDELATQIEERYPC
ncbi:MAG TPA: SDR family oxidoreductase [Gemmatimonadaceae bacterium]|nr:SDR family oxidoreductase [Gemmatimonadaceae bacterium]